MRGRRQSRLTLSGVVAVAALLLGVAAPAQADPLLLKLPDATVQITGFDPGPGNMLLTGVSTGGGPFVVGDVLETYFQANMSALLGTNGNPIPGLGLNTTYELTVVARYTQVVTSLTTTNGGKGFIANFALNPVQVNPFYEIWFHNGLLADNFNGTGFATGTKILSGIINNDTNSSFTVNDDTVTVPIDNPSTGGGTAAGKAYWNGSGTTTVQGTGNATMTLATMQVNSVVLNPAFFPGGQTVTSYTLRPSTGLEYQNVDPSKLFDALPNAGGTIAGQTQGNANGTAAGAAASDRLVIEIDDKDSLSATPAVTGAPEPASLTLLITGAVGLLGYGWRKRRQAA